MKLVLQDQTFSFELLRAVGYAAYDGAGIGEALADAGAARARAAPTCARPTTTAELSRRRHPRRGWATARGRG